MTRPLYYYSSNKIGSEIILRSKQVCNLSEVVVRSTDTFEDLKRKIRLATILGTLQSTVTSFRYLSKKWKDNTEEERLLGVSLTGIMDHPVLSGNGYNPDGFDDFVYVEGDNTYMSTDLKEVLCALKEVAIETNNEWASKLGIPASTAISCVKPSGTVSQLVDSSSGIHARHAPFYIRTVRTDKKDPLYQFLVEQGVPVEDSIGKEESTAVFSFPQKAPEGAVTRTDMTAIEQLELWKIYADSWCEHKPSVTISVKEDEWMEVGAWVYENFDSCSGVSFLPYSDHVYRQAPYTDMTEEDYSVMVEAMPSIEWEKLVDYETVDNTTTTHELACTAGSCEL